MNTQILRVPQNQSNVHDRQFFPNRGGGCPKKASSLLPQRSSNPLERQTQENPHIRLFHLYYPNVPLILSTMNSIRLPHPCLTAQTIRTGPVDPDVGGIAVGMSSMFHAFEKSMASLTYVSTQIWPSIFYFVSYPHGTIQMYATLEMIAILLRWSKHDLKTSIFMLLSQVYPILIATASSIGSGNLSLFDAHYAVAVTASPLTVYLVYSSFRDVFRRPNILFQKLTSSKAVVRCLGLLLPLLWLFVNLMTSFYTKAFNGSELCRGMTLSLWNG